MQIQKKGQQHKQGYQADLNKYFGKRLKIKLNGKRTIIGTVIGYPQINNISFDIFMNLVLDHCKELIPGQGAENKDNLYPGFSNVTDQLVDIGQAVVRGNAIIMWECLDRVRD